MSGFSFKELVRADLTGTFFNADEFADQHTINGRQMTVIIDENELIERSDGGSASVSRRDGLYTKHLLIYLRAEEYGPKPKLNALMDIDGRRTYRVIDCVDETGVYSVELEAVRA